MSARLPLERRRFLQLLGGGIVVLVGLGPDALQAEEAAHLVPEDFNAFLVVGENGRVTLLSGKVEMGQGVMTSQAQMLAEELGVALSAIDVVLGDTDRCPWDMGTYGSLTTSTFGPALRAAGARARSTLVSLAAGRLGVPEAQLLVHNGVVSVRGVPEKSISFGALSQGARMVRVVDQPAVLRAVATFQIIGTSPVRLDAIEKVTGAAKYAADIRRPGMLYAHLLRPPMHGATRTSLDVASAERLPGVTVVHEDDLVAVLHADDESAALGLAALRATWALPDATLDPDNIFEHLLATSPEPREVTRLGDPMAAHKLAVRLFETTFHKGYVAHAALEPHAALAEFSRGRMTVWASTQTPFPTRDGIAKALGLPISAVRVITPLIGGGFGGKSAFGQAIEAARLARITGKPVQVAWSRADEFYNDTFDPAALVTIASGVDPAGLVSLWDYSVIAAGTRGTTLPYAPPNLRIRSSGKLFETAGTEAPSVHPFAVGAWRGPGANMNVFAAESQIDIMAAALGIDALEFRLRNLTDARMRRVLQTAASTFGWKASTTPAAGGRGCGVACCIDAGTYVATMAEVQVDLSSGRVHVLRIVCAEDLGLVINPEGARMQIEGGLTMGLGYVLSEELRFHGGEILDRNFDSYEIPRFSVVPRIEAVLVHNDTLAPQGGGEPAITTTGAVIANAVYAATGVRMLRLPMLPARLKQAMLAQGIH